MTAAEFLTNFGDVANAPDGVARLRELMLHLAVSARLVSQDDSEGTSAEALQAISAEREQALKDGTINYTKPHPAANADDLGYVLPRNWSAVRLAEVVLEIQTGPFGSSLHKHDYQEGGTPVINPASLQDGRIIPIANMAIGSVILDRLKGFKLRCGDIVMARRGEMGRCAVVTEIEDGWLCGTGSLVLRMPTVCHAPFIALLIGAPASRRYLGGASVGTTMQNLNQSILSNMAFGLPPLAEQKRIVAKVDELMALCDQLEAKQQERERRFPVLSRTCHARFAEAPTPAILNRIFDETGAVSAEDMRKTIINFAVQGLLVNQEPKDEPAIAAWKRIQKVRLAAGEKDFGSLPHDELPFKIPKGWSWIKMGNLALSSDSGWSPQCESTPRNGINWGVLKVSAVSWNDFDPDENKALPAGMTPRPECEVHNGDFLLSRANTEDLVARSVVVTTTPPHLMMSDKIVRFVFPDELEKRFINLANSAAFARSHYAKHASGTSSSMKNVGRGTMCNLPIPLPPLAEQRRIVAKVDELMALVDQLEAQQQERDKLAEAFAKVCVASFTGTTQLTRPDKMKTLEEAR